MAELTTAEFVIALMLLAAATGGLRLARARARLLTGVTARQRDWRS